MANRLDLIQIRDTLAKLENVPEITQPVLAPAVKELMALEEKIELACIENETSTAIETVIDNYLQALTNIADNYSTSRFEVRIKKNWRGKVVRDLYRRPTPVVIKQNIENI